MSLYTALVSLYAKVKQSDVENLQPTLTKNVKQLLKKRHCDKQF